MLSPAWYATAVSAECSLGGTAWGRTELERIRPLENGCGRVLRISVNQEDLASVLFTMAKDQ